MLIAARLTTAGLTAAMAIVHLHLWSTGYRHVPTIGDLFLANALIGLVLGAVLLLVPVRMLVVAAAAAAVFTAGTIGGLTLSLTTGLFGFREFTGAPFLTESLVLESVGVVVDVALAGLYLPAGLRWYRCRPGQECRRPGRASSTSPS